MLRSEHSKPCPLLGVKRTLLSERVMSAFDPKRTLAGLKSRGAAVSYLGVRSMARPGGNVTGFTQFEYSLAGKWLELLKEIAPHVTRVGVLRDPTRGYGIGQFAVIQAMAPPHAAELTPIDAHDPALRNRAVVPRDGWRQRAAHRRLAARQRLNSSRASGPGG